MKKSKSMINETSNVYSGDDEGFESAPEKVIDTSIAKSLKVEMLWLIKVY